jgi:uncharacterized protein (DUF924 family)
MQAATHDSDVERVLSFWFGELDAQGCASKDSSERWFQRSDVFDDLVRNDFQRDYDAIMTGAREDWLATPRGRLAYIIVLDQLSRNMFRGSPTMFAGDGLALRASLEGIDMGTDRQLRTDERTFFYMPLMHAESLEHQERCVALFQRLRDEVEGEVRDRINSNLQYAIRHRDIIAQWGRFPHRNVLLGRTSTPAEVEFLKQPGSSF